MFGEYPWFLGPPWWQELCTQAVKLAMVGFQKPSEGEENVFDPEKEAAE